MYDLDEAEFAAMVRHMQREAAAIEKQARQNRRR
jgi:hypothetical protein